MTVNRLIDLLFERRGMTRDDYLKMESTVGGELQGMDQLVETLHDIYVKATSMATLVVAPDFDMDGIMSATVLSAGLAELGFPVELFRPDSHAGYGLSASEADRLVEEHPNARWVMTCDMGISARAGVKRLVERGLEVIVTDHHQESATTSSRRYAKVLVDPCGIGETYGLPGICGAQVAWRCMDAYAQAYGTTEQRDRIARLRVFAGIGTVSDLMPLVHENRQLVRDALSILRLVWANPDPWFVNSVTGSPAYTSAFRGLSCALSAFNDQHAFASSDAIDEKFLGFTFAPTFNAAKRLGIDMGHAYNVFLGDENARQLGMQVLLEANTERKRLVNETMYRIDEQANPYAPLCYIIDAPAGILGLVAAKLMSRSGMPTLVVRPTDDGGFAGSGRSPEWYPFLTKRSEQNFDMNAAGHEGAFGCSFASLEALNRETPRILTDIQATHDAMPIVSQPDVDLVVATDGTGDVGFDVPLLSEFVTTMDSYRPFGRGWEAPRVRMVVRAREFTATAMGKQGQHLSVRTPTGMRCVCWNEGELVDGLVGHDVSITGDLVLSTWNGETGLELIGSVDR